MAEDYWGNGYWGTGYWASGFWGQGGTLAPAVPVEGDVWIKKGIAVLAKPRSKRKIQLIRDFLEAEQYE